jgi:tRNA (adenine22-N1)-methyltransferase
MFRSLSAGPGYSELRTTGEQFLLQLPQIPLATGVLVVDNIEIEHVLASARTDVKSPEHMARMPQQGVLRGVGDRSATGYARGMSSLSERIVAAGRALTRPGRAPAQPLSPRLSIVAELVPEGSVVADIGTDHAWLPIHLVHTKRAPRAVAADLRSGPLDGARARVEEHRLAERIELRLGNGLSVLTPGEVSVVTIAGMGGKRIADLVAAAPKVVGALDRLVVQPNTEVGRVREQLRAAGLRLVDERLVVDEGHWYTTLAWEPGGESRDWDALDVRFGPCLRTRADPELRRFLGAELARVAQVLARARRGGAQPASLAALQNELADIEHELARLAIVAGTIQKA